MANASLACTPAGRAPGPLRMRPLRRIPAPLAYNPRATLDVTCWWSVARETHDLATTVINAADFGGEDAALREFDHFAQILADRLDTEPLARHGIGTPLSSLASLKRAVITQADSLLCDADHDAALARLVRFVESLETRAMSIRSGADTVRD